MKNNGLRALILSDRIELTSETGDTLKEFGLNPYHIVAGQMKAPPSNYQVYIAMSQTLRRRIHKDGWGDFFDSFDVVVIDECFIAGTKIDGKNIEDLKCGDFVNSMNHKTGKIEKKKILNTFKNPIKDDLLLIKFKNTEFICTKGHPVYVINKGYVEASRLLKNDRVVLHNLWEYYGEERFPVEQLVRKSKTILGKWIFFLFRKVQKLLFCSNAFEKNEREQSNVEHSNQGEGFENYESERAQTYNPRRQRQGDDKATGSVVRRAWNRLVSRICSCNRRWISATSLQNRYSESKINDSSRGGWPFSWINKGENKGCQKRETFGIERIQSVEIQEQRGIEGCDNGEKQNYVYNIEVEDNNNYFANGILVHNCHKQEFNPYFEQQAFTNDPYIIGFTATPVRNKKQRQLSTDYSALIVGPQVPELIRSGYLVKDRYFPVDSVDMKGTRLNSFGDYQESAMFEKFNKPELYVGAVENWKKLTPDTITLGFCVNIQHVIATCKAFNEAGVTAKFLVSELSKPQFPENPTEAQRVRYRVKSEEYEIYRDAINKWSGPRKEVLREWKRGDFHCLFNAGILTTGFNHKPIETILMYRATTSVVLWLQMLGRGSRIFPGKSYFNVLDFGGNGERLGYYNQMREYSLSHDQGFGGGAAPMKECGEVKQKPKKDKTGRDGCGARVFASLVICPYCGYMFEKEKKETFVWLEELDYTKKHIDTKSEEITVDGTVLNFAALERTREERGYKANWVIVQAILAAGENGLKEYSKWKREREPNKFGNGWFYGTRSRFSKMIDDYNKKQPTNA